LLTANKIDDTIMLLINGVKYNLWIPQKEEQLEETVKEHSKEIFEENSLYFDLKQKLTSKAPTIRQLRRL